MRNGAFIIRALPFIAIGLPTIALTDRGWHPFSSQGVSMHKFLQVVIVIVVGVTVMFGGRWYMYVAHGDSPYSEVGIALNGYAPGPLRRWGCHRMQTRFAGQLPPYGCAAPDGRGWM